MGVRLKKDLPCSPQELCKKAGNCFTEIFKKMPKLKSLLLPESHSEVD